MDVQRPSVVTHLSRDDVAAHLRSGGFRVTGPRLAVFEALGQLSGHQSADDVAGQLRRNHQTLSRASVYNALGVLDQVGLVVTADAGLGRTLYEIVGSPHHHFVCRSCGKVLDVPRTVDTTPGLATSPPGTVVERTDVVYRGLCAGCNT